MFGLFVIAFFVFTVLGAYQQQGDAASTSDQQDVAEAADAQSGPSTVAEISEQPEAQGSAMFATSTHSALPGLGTVEFPTSASSKEGQAHFVRGVAALHSFWYPVALNEFREATRMEPDFMMAYWGQAMAHNHPLWGDPQETQAGREVIEKIRISPELTPRERAWLNAVKVLYGEGDKVVRDKAYAEAMEKIYRAYPDDAEAALFYALALMESVRPEDSSGVQTRLRAGGIASQVFKQKPDHPGAAHYVIHAYDDPKHARMALDAIPGSLPPHRTRCICPRTSSCSSGYGWRRLRRTRQPWPRRENKARSP